MDCRQDQVVLIEQGYTSLIACGIRWIEREFGEEALAGAIAGRDLFQLDKVGFTGFGILMDAFEVRSYHVRTCSSSAGHPLYRREPARSHSRRSASHLPFGAGQGLPSEPGSDPQHYACGPARVEPRSGQRPAGVASTGSRHTITRVLDKPEHREEVLDVSSIEELEAAELHEWDVAPGQLHLQRPRMVAGQDTVLHCLMLPRVQLFQIGRVRGHGRIIPVGSL
jgi:hypothetical protein